MDSKEIRLINLKNLIAKHGRAASFAEKVGTAPAMISQIVSQKAVRNVGDELARKIELSLGLERGWMDHMHGMLTSDWPATGFDATVDQGPRLRKQVPVISWVAAGSWCDAEDPYPVGMAESWEECPYDHSERSACLRVVGDSMSPEYREGELILVDPAIEAGHGDDVIARTPDGKATFKRLQVTPDGMFLIALNQSYPERIVRIPKDTHICGVVTASWMQRRKR